MTRRILSFAYGVASYAIFFGTFLYAIGFVGNLFVPTTLDGPRSGSLVVAIAINLGLLATFAIQHSVMARPAFKRVWTRIVPVEIERSTYVLFSSLALLLMFWQWRPLGGLVWDVHEPASRALMYTVFAAGWALVLFSTFLINHFDLFGLRQVWLQLIGRPYTPVRFRTPAAYRVVRHPLYVGFVLAFWATPTMSVAHLLFAAMTTAYILIAIQLEERDLIREHGDRYLAYRRQVPMLVPRLGRRRPTTAADAA